MWLMMEAEIGEMRFEDERKGHKQRDVSWGAEKGKKQILLPEP